MAVLKMGSIVTEIKGKIGGHVYQKCGNMLSVRTNPARKISTSASSQLARSRISSLSKTYSSLSYENKNSFTTNASTWPTFDKWGNKTSLGGLQLFNLINCNMINCGASIVNMCQAYSTPSSTAPSLDSINTGDETFTIYKGISSPTPVYYLVYISNPVKYINSSVSYPKRILTGLLVNYMEPRNLYNDILNLFDPALYLNQFLQVDILEVQQGTGFFIWRKGLEIAIG